MMRPSRLLVGALAGLVATVPMTLVMLLVQRRLPRHERHRLPPEQITAHVTRTTGLRRMLARGDERVLAWVLHFGFGATAGTTYAALAGCVPLRAWLKGLLFGIVVWVGSYFGVLPSLEIHGHGGEQSPRRNALMLAAHIVWGVTLGVLVDTWHGRAISSPSAGADWSDGGQPSSM